MLQPFDLSKADALFISQKNISKRVYELGNEKDIYAEITFEGVWNPVAILQTANSSWKITKPSIWQRKLIISDAATSLPVAVVNRKWTELQQLIQFNNGAIVKFKPASISGNRYELEDDRQQTLATFKVQNSVKQIAVILPHKNSINTSQLLLLYLFGSYSVINIKTTHNGAA